MLTDSDFHKVSVPQQVAGRIAAAIERGEYAAGDNLPTTRQLAEQYGISLRTVNVALRELESRDLVECRPRSGAYVKSSHDARTRTGRRVAVVGRSHVGDMDRQQSWGGRILAGLETELLQQGMRLESLAYLPDERDPVGAIASQLREAGDGLVGATMFSDQATDDMIAALDKRGLPWVSINKPHRRATHNFVDPDSVGAGVRVGEAMAAAGIDHAIMLGPLRGQLLMDEATGFMQGYLAAGAPIHGIEHVDTGPAYTEQAGYETMRDLLREYEPPQAVFALGDLYAIGALRACREAGLSVPGDVAIVSDTGTPLTEYSDPPISSLVYPTDAVGREVGRMLIEMHHRGVNRLPGRYVSGRLDFRASFKPSAKIQRHVNRNIV